MDLDEDEFDALLDAMPQGARNNVLRQLRSKETGGKVNPDDVISRKRQQLQVTDEELEQFRIEQGLPPEPKRLTDNEIVALFKAPTETRQNTPQAPVDRGPALPLPVEWEPPQGTPQVPERAPEPRSRWLGVVALFIAAALAASTGSAAAVAIVLLTGLVVGTALALSR